MPAENLDNYDNLVFIVMFNYSTWFVPMLVEYPFPKVSSAQYLVLWSLHDVQQTILKLFRINYKLVINLSLGMLFSPKKKHIVTMILIVSVHYPLRIWDINIDYGNCITVMTCCIILVIKYSRK